MTIWHITGGRPLRGTLAVQGSKNAVLPILAASILTPCETELIGVPDLRDVRITLRILRHLGCEVQREGDHIWIDSRPLHGYEIPHSLMRELRSSVIFLGAILARCGQARLSLPGGCELGPRPVDLHLEALRTIGASVTEQGGDIVCRGSDLRGARIILPFPSVGATENAMLAACAARGVTVISNAAREPEIVNLQKYLRALGARISGAGSAEIRVEGMSPAPFVRHAILPVRIAASTLLCACAAAGGEITLTNVFPSHFLTVLDSLSEAGCDIITKSGAVTLKSDARLIAPRPVVTRPYPGFPTDAQPPLMAACLKARGTSVFTETIFSNRYRHALELRRLGADVSIEGRVAYISGVDRLTAAPLTAGDLRGGAAMIVAALAAEGESEIFDEEHISRGYDRLDCQLAALGADISCRRVSN